MSTPVITRPRVFLDVQIGTEPAGRLVIELFSDKTPKTCENFRALCTSSYTPPSASKPLTYKLSPFHRIIDEFMIQGGDITAGDRTGGQSIYDGEFADENIGWRHIDKEGLVCMANRGKGTNSSQFFITLAPCEHLNAKHTIFGHVVSGQPVLNRLAKLGVDKSDKPYDAVLISHCGQLEQRNTHKPLPAPSQQQPTQASAKPNGSNDRGRHRAKRSPSSSATSTQTRHRTAKHPQASHSSSPQQKRQARQARRRSDILVDETRRGRSLTRSQSPSSPPHKHRSPSPRPRRRKRSPSRSSARARSRSPHLRRRHTRSRSRSERMKGRQREKEREEERWRDEEVLRREEWEREGRGRWEGVLDEGEGRKNGAGAGYERERDGRGGRVGEGRLGGAGEGDGEEVKFKGRGSMKYRERRW